MKKYLIIALLLCSTLAWGEDEFYPAPKRFEKNATDYMLEMSKLKTYRVKIAKKATLDDIKWLFNEAVCMHTEDPKIFKGREKSFMLLEESK